MLAAFVLNCTGIACNKHFLLLNEALTYKPDQHSPKSQFIEIMRPDASTEISLEGRLFAQLTLLGYLQLCNNDVFLLRLSIP